MGFGISKSGRNAVAVAAGIAVGTVGLAACSVSSQNAAAPPSTPVPARNGLTHVVTDAKTPVGAFFSPLIRGDDVYISQSKDGGSIYNWSAKSLPKSPTSDPVVAPPKSTWKPDVAGGVKMEQIAFDGKGANLLIAKKAIKAGNLGGNSVWSYPFKGEQTSGAGTNLVGLATSVQGDGYYAWGPNPTVEAISAYNAKAFPQPTGTDAPTQAAIGNGGGVTIADYKNGKVSGTYLYFGSLQSGCVYKQNLASGQTWVDYCIPNLGSGNQNQSVYSLDTDSAGNVYAMFQGSVDAAGNTIILKIVPGGDGQSSDKIQSLQLPGYARSTGMAVNSDGSRIFANGVSVADYDKYQTNTILDIVNPVWGPAGAPDKPAANKPVATTIPAASDPWLTGINLVDKKGNKGDLVYIADNNNGFWIVYL